MSHLVSVSTHSIKCGMLFCMLYSIDDEVYNFEAALTIARFARNDMYMRVDGQLEFVCVWGDKYKG